MKLKKFIGAAAITFFAAQASANVTVVNQGLSEQEVLDAQNGWCAALLDISKTNEDKGQAEAAKLAKNIIDAAYGYQMGGVLFKPTLTVVPQTFRPTSEGALSYFVGGNDNFPNDKGFALMGWTNCEVDNNAVFIAGDSASTIGKVHFTAADGSVTSVDKTWGFVKDDAGAVRIVLHHSSLEYTG
ncbi:hypothetical protein KJ365_12570 [Glaciecola sp. XM2]|jgi:hypothetical protein|uniref:hypothetical protein n=1 Tax=Glaciecola sp. XM2 TaxID=1914931 RepID=UPI001BDE537C|nr:hypothetical protein [Glaciecola sp. XM2]MBT1451717.1 hypothetical protein [Glaciecola sp. XM2]